MVYFITGDRGKQKKHNTLRRKAEDWYDGQQLKNPHVGKEDYTTPTPNQEAIKLSQEAQVRTKDSGLQSILQTEIKRLRKKPHGSGIKKSN